MSDMKGMLLINKPLGITSHDVVVLLRDKLRVRRIGHTGTLDPLAEGLLVLLIGEATKQQRYLQSHNKVYEVVIHFGERTTTGDAEGSVIQTADVSGIDSRRIERALRKFHGSIQQTPPRFSAVKVRGRPAYWWARRSEEVKLTPKTIKIYELSLLESDEKEMRVRVCCSAGTYIRVLAEDIAEELGTVGYVTSLVRCSVSEWSLDEAHDLEWIKQSKRLQILECLRPVLSNYASV